MSARIVNVRPKPGFLMDGAGDIIPARANVVAFNRDRLTNVMSGKGTTADRSVWARYAFIPVDPVEAEAAYRSGGLFRKVIDIPPLDMTKAWRDWQTKKNIIEKLEAEEKRHQLKAKCKRALILSRLHGGGALLLGTNDSDPMQPINPTSIKTGGLRYIRVMSRYQLTLGDQRLDPADPWVDKPEYFEINVGQGRPSLRLHPSRIVEFIGQPVPEGSHIGPGGLAGSWFWGDPLMQSLSAAVKNADLAKDGFAGLIDRASVDVLKLKDLMSIVGTAEGETQIGNRLAAANMGKSNYRALVLDTEDEWNQLQVNWSGIPDVIDKYLQIVSGESDIPVTRLLGQSPKGLQSTGEGEERDYQAMISGRQDETLTPALDRVDEVLVPSALGSHPSDIYYTYAPLQDESEKDGAEIEFKYAQAFKTRADTGSLPESALAAIEKNRMIESGRYPGSETAFEEAEAAGDDPLDPANQPNEADVPAIETVPPVQQPTAKRGKQPKPTS